MHVGTNLDLDSEALLDFESERDLAVLREEGTRCRVSGRTCLCATN